MRKIGKTILTIFVVLFSVTALGLTALTFGIKLVDQSGWSRTKSGGVYYLDWEGNPQTGWKTIDGSQYYFDPLREGLMVQGWLQIEDAWYYFDDSGILQTGWLDLSGSRFYLREDGTMASGWQEVDEGLYYFDEEGELETGWLDLDGRRFYLGIDGNACFGWQDTAQGTCYLTLDGTVYTGWQEVDGQRYYFNEEGFLLYGWLTYENEHYYLDSQGVMATGWLDLEAGRYYLDEDGSLQTGWLALEEGRYFLGTDGIMDTGWVAVGGSQYYLADDGRMHTGWLEQDGARYYFGSDGAMAVGQVDIDGTNCFFTSQGKYVLLVNRDNPVPADYAPELVEYEGHLVSKECLEPLQQLLADCAAAGHEYSVNYIYRSQEEQQAVWDILYAEYLDEGYSEEEALLLVDQRAMPPGYSEHQLGLAADVGGGAEMYRWLRENAWRYGFIIRYPEGKTGYTEVTYEPWHIRYVGLELAQELYELDMCMEEYMESLTK